MIKADNIFQDEKYLYAVLSSKVSIYDKTNFKVIKSLSIKNISNIITDLNNDLLIVVTTKSEVFIYSLLEFNLIMNITLKSEAFNALYHSKHLYLACLKLEDKAYYLYKLDIDNKSYIESKVEELYSCSPIEINNNQLVLLCDKVNDIPNKSIKLRTYDESLCLIAEKEVKINIIHPNILNGYWMYDNITGIENIKTHEFITYKELDINDKSILWAKYINDNYIFSNYKKAYIFSNDFKLLNIIENEKNIQDICLDKDHMYTIIDDYVYLNNR